METRNSLIEQLRDGGSRWVDLARRFNISSTSIMEIYYNRKCKRRRIAEIENYLAENLQDNDAVVVRLEKRLERLKLSLNPSTEGE